MEARSSGQAAQLPETVGPYVLERLLGRGGYGAVHVARHATTGTVVALKTVTVPSKHHLAGMRREIACLAAIAARGIPGLPRFVERGVERGLPWVAMELVSGPTLRQLIVGTSGVATGYEPTLPLGYEREAHEPAAHVARLRDLLGVVERACLPLALLHGEGLVHCDVKPENIIMRASGEAVIVDFGLASRFSGEVSRDSLEIAGETAGTLSYISPEQIRGEHVDARADLYALGCLLYELCAGRPPFAGPRSIDVIRQHLEVDPPPLPRGAGISVELGLVIARMLAKDARDRVGYAEDVALALQRSRGDAPRPLLPRPRPHLFRTGFVGRAETLRVLQHRLQDVRRGAGGVVFIGAESGAGKTRLLKEVGGRARALSLDVLVAESPGDGRDAPLGHLRRVLQEIGDRCRTADATTAARLLGDRASRLAAYEPSLSDLPGVVLDAAPPLPPRASRQRLLADVVETLRAVAETEGLVLAMDDLQWADELTLDLLRFLVGALPECPVLVLAAYRIEEQSDRLRSIASMAGASAITLDRLDESAVESLCADALAVHPPPADLVRFLADVSEGNPFFVAEYLHGAVDERLLVREEMGAWRLAQALEGLPLPRSLRELLSRRLDRLDPAVARIAEAASIVAREIAEDILKAMLAELGVPVAAAEDGIAVLLASQVLEGTGAGTLRFTHDKVRDAAYGRLSPEARAAGHAACARAIEATALRSFEAMSELARHWDAAGEVARAATLCREAAPLAASAGAFEAAERLYRRYLAIAPSPSEERARAQNALGWDVLRLTSRFADALDSHRAALDEARAAGSRVEAVQALRGIGNSLRLRGDVDACLATARQALDLARQCGADDLVSALTTDIGIVTLERGDIEGALAIHQSALARARDRCDRSAEATSLSNIAAALGAQGDVAAAMAAQEEAVLLLRMRGEKYALGIALLNLAAFCIDAGEDDRGAAILEEGIALNRSTGNRQIEAIMLSNFALFLHGQGQREEARELVDRALALHELVGDRRSHAISLGHSAGFLLDAGDPAGAEAAYGRALETMTALGDARYAAQVRIELARCRRLGGGIADPGELDGAIAALDGMGDASSATAGRVEHVSQALARGEDGLRELGAARAALVALGARGTAALRRAFESVELAVELRRSGGALRDGEAPGGPA